MNKITIIGNLTRDPELRYTQNNRQVCNFSVAVNIRGFGQSREEQAEMVNYYRVTVWGPQGENAAKYLAKGRRVAVSGSLYVRDYVGNDGVARYSLDVNADEVEFLSAAPGSAGGEERTYAAGSNAQYPSGRTSAPPPGLTPIDDDELPF